ncbi:LAQU0S01e15852g1_1 [Lachancea quebecensis]|uniref:LAQU0S01e15852g1_1 n=1 Tax=Lachancea quebecensis TaxID=1654605 RepID=A0A0P1KN68_9SACH|nr:LAQU0S01e15852g1_1 [Lachancea quebecensis]
MPLRMSPVQDSLRCLSSKSTQSSDEEDGTERMGGADELDIPQLNSSMTPWRKRDVGKESVCRQDSTLVSPAASASAKCGNDFVDGPLSLASPVNSRPHTRSSLFSEGYTSSVPTLSASSNNEVEQLQRQLTACKLRLRALAEVIKELNYDRETHHFNEGSNLSLNAKLVDTLPPCNKCAELSKGLVELRQSLETKDKELSSIKNDYSTVLDDVNSYLEHSDVIASNIDEILLVLSEKLDISAEEKEVLSKARTISNNFVDVKINALGSTIRKFLDTLSTAQPPEQFDKSLMSLPDNSQGNLSQMDTRLESAIESMHEEYHAFLRSLQDRMDQSGDTERLLGDKLKKQQLLIEKLAKLFHERSITGITADMLSMGMHAFEGTKNTGYMENSPQEVAAPNDETVEYKHQLEIQSSRMKELEEEIAHLEQKNEELGKGNAERNRILGTGVLCEEKELEWVAKVEHLTSEVSKSNTESQRLEKIITELRRELSVAQEESEKTILDLEKTLKRAVRNSGLYMGENREMQQHIKEIESQLSSAMRHNSQLEESINEVTEDRSGLENELQKLRSHLILHLNKIFDVFDKILQRHSIDQAKKKLKNLEALSSNNHHKAIHAKLESLYVFIESAINSIVEEHAKLLLKEKRRSSQINVKDTEEGYGSQLHIELLERRWVAERERRKLDADAAEYRISQLEDENRALRLRLRDRFGNNQ